MVDAGKLSRRITLQKPTVTRGNDGSEVHSFVSIPSVWAEHISSGGREFYAAQKINAEVTDVFRIRYRTGIYTNWRVEFGNRVLQITFLDYSGQKNGEMILHCKEVV